LGDCAKLESFWSRGHAKPAAQCKQSVNVYARNSEFSGSDKPVADHQFSESNDSVTNQSFEPTRHDRTLFGDVDSNRSGHKHSKYWWPPAVLRGEQRLQFSAGFDAESFEFPEHTRNSKQAAQHAARHDGSGKQHAVHGCRRHGPDTRLVLNHSIPGGTFPESRHSHAQPRSGHARAGNGDAQTRDCHSKRRDRNSKSGDRNAKHNSDEPRHSVKSRPRHDCSNDSEFAEQWHAFHPRFYAESRRYETAAQSAFAARVSDLKVRQSFKDSLA